jgi:hemoglobin-like flavoprotein
MRAIDQSRMTMDKVRDAKVRIENAVALSGLLHRAERHELRLSADQYRRLVEQLKAALKDELPENALDKILTAFPAAGELYENMHYERSGLSRSPLDRSVASETMATQVLERIAKRSDKA